MTRESDDEQLLENLVNRMLEGLADDVDIERLDVLLASSPELLDHYIDLTSIHSMLQWRLGRAAESAAEVSSATIAEPDAATTNVPLRSPVRGFLGDITSGLPNLSAFSSSMWALAVLLTGIAVTVGIVAVRNRQTHVVRPESDIVHQKPEVAPNTSPAATVARVTRMIDCRWIVESAAPTPGEQLKAGQTLHLAAGVVSLDFDIGARLILQGPAELSILSAKELRLDRGKLAAEITAEKAHGFTVYTPQGKLVDLGTEFGIEIAPEGSSKMHVFRGKVEVTLPPTDGHDPVATQCLLANGSMRVDAHAETMALVGDTGESYVRSLDSFKKEHHVIAYWRFEDRPLGTLAPHTNRNKAPIRATVDSSFNGNDLYSWSDEARPGFSGAVGEERVPQTHSENRSCLDTTKALPKTYLYGGRNAYTHSAFSHAAPVDIQKITPAQWTIEASVRPLMFGSTEQTIIGRDTHFMGDENPDHAPPRLSLEVTKDRRFAIRFIDADNRPHQAIANQLLVNSHRWYHLAAISDGRLLSLYVDERNGLGYQLLASTPLPSTGSTALGKGEDTAEWSVARGVDKGISGKFFHGYIDEVRISDIARKPTELLFAKGPQREHDNTEADRSESRSRNNLE